MATNACLIFRLARRWAAAVEHQLAELRVRDRRKVDALQAARVCCLAQEDGVDVAEAVAPRVLVGVQILHSDVDVAHDFRVAVLREELLPVCVDARAGELLRESERRH